MKHAPIDSRAPTLHVTPTMTTPSPVAHAAVIQDDMNLPRANGGTEEISELWSASEGQVTNAHIFLLAVLTFWLVLPVFYALYRYLRTANHCYTLTNQRLIEQSGIFVKQVESVELYRVKDMSVSGTVAPGRYFIRMRTRANTNLSAPSSEVIVVVP